MMGQHDRQTNLFSYSVNLDKRIRADHPLRAVSRALGDLDWVRQAVAPCYGRNGNVSVDPVVLVKLMVLLFLDNVASERELMAIVPERLDYLWFLGYGLDEEVPNHSVLSKARARWGAALFEELFVGSVLLCVRAGLVEGTKLHIDSSLVKANASRDSVVAGSPELIAALRRAAREQAGKLEAEALEGVNANHISTTDPEATLARSNRQQPAQLSYKHHRTVDDAQGVITAVKTTTGKESDPAQLLELREQHQAHTQVALSTVVGDSHYGTAENYRQCQAAGVTPHLKRYVGPSGQNGKLTAEEFCYESQADRYRCPQGHYLYYHNFKKSDQAVEYRIADAAQCARCPLRARCTDAKHGRSLTRPVFEELVQAGQTQAASAAAKADLRRRKHLMEGSFADAANNHGFKRARWRGLWRQRIQDWMIALVQNIRIWMRRSGKGQLGVIREAAQSVLRQLVALNFFLGSAAGGGQPH